MDNDNNSNIIFDTSALTIKELTDGEFYSETTSKLSEILRHEFVGVPSKQEIKKIGRAHV